MMKRSDSLPARLAGLEVGGRLYIETTTGRYKAVQRAVGSSAARMDHGRQRYTTQLFTAVAARQVGEVRYLVCVERVR